MLFRAHMRCILIIMIWRLRWIEEDVDVDGGVVGGDDDEGAV